MQHTGMSKGILINSRSRINIGSTIFDVGACAQMERKHRKQDEYISSSHSLY